MKNKYLLYVLCATTVMQICTLIYQISSYEYILNFGKTIMLRTRPIDPYDAFRGRYVALDLASVRTEKAKYSCKDNCEHIPFYISYTLENNESVINKISMQKPDNDLPYLKLKPRVSRFYDEPDNLVFNYPFDRLYMQEDIAMNVDRYNREVFDRHVVVVIKAANGKGIVQDVLVDGTPLAEYVKTLAAQKKRDSYDLDDLVEEEEQDEQEE